ncbi:MAG: carbonic anhydrase family protein [Rickettsiales bacterium]|nr:carbonic anhydrase family protein [Rickettsiales bacterium]
MNKILKSYPLVELVETKDKIFLHKAFLGFDKFNQRKATGKRKLLFLLTIFVSACSAKWSYEGKTAPDHWGDVEKEKFKFCKIGYNQSPINIDLKSKKSDNQFKDSELKFSYSNLGVTKELNPNFVIFTFDRKDFLTIRKKPYYLQSLQFHHPSEHQINGEEQALEMQIFHKSDSEQIAALSVLVKVGKENSEFNKLIDLLKNPKKDDVWSEFNVGKVIDKNSKLFFYDGSLTTPPCTEGVKWFVMEKESEMSKEQMNEIIKLALKGKTNQRPTQAFHPELY